MTLRERERLVTRIKKAQRRLQQDPDKFPREQEVLERLKKVLNGTA